MTLPKILCLFVSLITINQCHAAAIAEHPDSSPKLEAATSQQHPLTISLDTSFPEKLNDGTLVRQNFLTVAQDILQVVQGLSSGAKLPDNRPIVLYDSSGPVPITDATSDPAIIWVGIVLSEDDLHRLDYTRFTFQLGHELGHVIMDARRSNGLIETLADAISLQVLDGMAKLWRIKYADFEPWKDYAPHFQEYREQHEKEKLSELPREIQDAVQAGRWSDITVYLKKRQPELDANPFNETGLALRNLGAMALRSDTVPWKSFVGMASLTNPSPSQDGKFNQDLPTDITRAPPDAQDALHRLGR